jgi:hypothetical protein
VPAGSRPLYLLGEGANRRNARLAMVRVVFQPTLSSTDAKLNARRSVRGFPPSFSNRGGLGLFRAEKGQENGPKGLKVFKYTPYI